MDKFDADAFHHSYGLSEGEAGFSAAADLTEDQRVDIADADAWVASYVQLGIDGPLKCADGLDNDGDSKADWPRDPGCGQLRQGTEAPECQDGLDNNGNSKIDFDGGASALVSPVGVPDPGCASFRDSLEGAGCGLGYEVGVVGVLLRRYRRRFSSHL